MAWSAGAGRVVQHVAPFAAKLAAVDEAMRWPALMHAVALAHPTGHRHLNAAYSCARTAQKLEAGRTDDAWFGAVDAPLYEAIARLGYP